MKRDADDQVAAAATGSFLPSFTEFFKNNLLFASLTVEMESLMCFFLGGGNFTAVKEEPERISAEEEVELPVKKEEEEEEEEEAAVKQEAEEGQVPAAEEEQEAVETAAAAEEAAEEEAAEEEAEEEEEEELEVEPDPERSSYDPFHFELIISNVDELRQWIERFSDPPPPPPPPPAEEAQDDDDDDDFEAPPPPPPPPDRKPRPRCEIKVSPKTR